MASDGTGAAFHHERLDVYSVSLKFVSLAHEIITAMPRGRGSLADQLQRAATSIALNTAEGCGEFSRSEKVRFYRMALRSAAESAAVLDVALRTGAISAATAAHGKHLLGRIRSMLVAMVKSRQA